MVAVILLFNLAHHRQTLERYTGSVESTWCATSKSHIAGYQSLRQPGPQLKLRRLIPLAQDVL